jgi:hypothetical protein
MKYIKKFNENIADDILDKNKTLKDLKDNGLIYTVGAVKRYLKDPQNKWNVELMPFPENLMILNILIGGKIGQYHFKKCVKSRNTLDEWNWISKIKKEDLDSFPIPDEVYKDIVG